VAFTYQQPISPEIPIDSVIPKGTNIGTFVSTPTIENILNATWVWADSHGIDLVMKDIYISNFATTTAIISVNSNSLIYNPTSWTYVSFSVL
jgi:hypothetical protein